MNPRLPWHACLILYVALDLKLHPYNYNGDSTRLLKWLCICSGMSKLWLNIYTPWCMENKTVVVFIAPEQIFMNEFRDHHKSIFNNPNGLDGVVTKVTNLPSCPSVFSWFTTSAVAIARLALTGLGWLAVKNIPLLTAAVWKQVTIRKAPKRRSEPSCTPNYIIAT